MPPAFIYSTFLGGSGWDQGTAIAVDASGGAYVAGDTQSGNFPILSTVQLAFGGQTDGFVTKLSSGGAIAFSTFLGRTAAEHISGIAVDSSNNIYVAGGTFSTNFPVSGAIQGVNRGGQDAFVSKISAGGTGFAYSTYLGGTGGSQATPEHAKAIAVDTWRE